MTIFLTWLHVIAAVSWIGGMVFLSFILAPLLRNGSLPGAPALFRAAALRFRMLVWSAITVLLTTGPMLTIHRAIPLFEPDRWPSIFALKLSLVALLLLLTAAHDLVLGPLASRISAQPPSFPTSQKHILLRVSRWLPRLALVTALAVLVAAVWLARSE